MYFKLTTESGSLYLGECEPEHAPSGYVELDRAGFDALMEAERIAAAEARLAAMSGQAEAQPRKRSGGMA